MESKIDGNLYVNLVTHGLDNTTVEQTAEDEYYAQTCSGNAFMLWLCCRDYGEERDQHQDFEHHVQLNIIHRTFINNFNYPEQI